MTARLGTRTKEFNAYARYCLLFIDMAEAKAIDLYQIELFLVRITFKYAC